MMQVTLIDQSDRFVFKPLLYDMVAGVAQPWEVSTAKSHICDDCLLSPSTGRRPWLQYSVAWSLVSPVPRA